MLALILNVPWPTASVRMPTAGVRIAKRVARAWPLTALRATAESWWDVVRRVWVQSAEDNVFFLAGGLAFNVLLALLPFMLLLVSGMALLLGAQPEQAARTIVGLMQAFLPDDAPSATELLRSVIEDVQRTK